jgi:hypothetical protein
MSPPAPSSVCHSWKRCGRWHGLHGDFLFAVLVAESMLIDDFSAGDQDDRAGDGLLVNRGLEEGGDTVEAAGGKPGGFGVGEGGKMLGAKRFGKAKDDI